MLLVKPYVLSDEVYVENFQIKVAIISLEGIWLT